VKVLILHQHFKTPLSGGAIRSYYLAKALLGQGVKVSVITGYNGTVYRQELTEGIDIHYLPVPYDNRFGFYGRSVSFVRYVWQTLRLARRFRDYDFCYAISVPLTIGIAARVIKHRYQIPYLFEVGDLWPDAPIQMGFIKNRLFQRALYRLEKSIYQSASSIVALSSEIQKALIVKVAHKTIHLIPNMADTGFYMPQPKQLGFSEKYNVRGKFVVAYVGAAGFANGLEHFVGCANESQRSKLPVHFILCGDGAVLPEIQKNVRELALANFTIVPFQNRDGVREILNIADAAFVSYRPIPVLETGSPNKYFDGLAAGKLIIINFGGWIRKEIEEERCGIYVDQRSPGDFANKLRPFLHESTLLEEYQTSARRLAERKYSRVLLSERFYKIFSS
jgi:glycosyltransferase involved in cell wall biosynthesis